MCRYVLVYVCFRTSVCIFMSVYGCVHVCLNVCVSVCVFLCEKECVWVFGCTLKMRDVYVAEYSNSNSLPT